MSDQGTTAELPTAAKKNIHMQQQSYEHGQQKEIFAKVSNQFYTQDAQLNE